MFETVDAHGAFLSLFRGIITLKLRRPVRAGLSAFATPLTLFAVDKDGSVLLFFIDGPGGTVFKAYRFFAVIAEDGDNVEPYIRERSGFILMNSQPLGRAWRYIVPIFTSYCA